jgi:hypothetical protein
VAGSEADDRVWCHWLQTLPELVFAPFCDQMLPILQPEPSNEVGERDFRYR